MCQSTTCSCNKLQQTRGSPKLIIHPHALCVQSIHLLLNIPLLFYSPLSFRGICVFSPLFIRLVIACTIPASFALDLLFHHDQLKETNVPLRVAGALLITFGFVLFTMSQSLSQRVASASPSADLSSSYQHQHRKDNSQYHSHQQLPPMSTY